LIFFNMRQICAVLEWCLHYRDEALDLLGMGRRKAFAPTAEGRGRAELPAPAQNLTLKFSYSSK
jgi:hypothetical protein